MSAYLTPDLRKLLERALLVIGPRGTDEEGMYTADAAGVLAEIKAALAFDRFTR